MKKVAVAIALLLLTLMTSFVFSAQNSKSIEALYVFGDSLSDVGAVFRATGGAYPPNPPYFQGRYSNGQVWVEYLADQLKIAPRQTHNFACGGATTGSDRNALVPGLLTQVQTLGQKNFQSDPDALYVVWAGANDYLQGVTDTQVPVGNVIQALAALVDLGAKQFLVGNLPDLGQLPATFNSGNASSLSRLTEAHNQALRRSLKQFNQQHADLQIITLDAHRLYREARTNPAQFGLTNVLSTCLVGAKSCANPSQYLFWDGIHPTTATHQIIGKAAYTALEDEA